MADDLERRRPLPGSQVQECLIACPAIQALRGEALAREARDQGRHDVWLEKFDASEKASKEAFQRGTGVFKEQAEAIKHLANANLQLRDEVHKIATDLKDDHAQTKAEVIMIKRWGIFGGAVASFAGWAIVEWMLRVFGGAK